MLSLHVLIGVKIKQVSVMLRTNENLCSIIRILFIKQAYRYINFNIGVVHMKLGSIVRTAKTGLGLYMYPHERPVKNTTTCSILSRKNNLIYHLPFSDIKPYNNTCWHCGHKVNSEDQITCNSCHWVSCPVCGACKQGGCSPDGIVILDVLANRGWEELTGYDICAFFDDYANDEYYYLGQATTVEVERCYASLRHNGLVPIVIVDDIGIVSLYVDTCYSQQAETIITSINGRLTDSLMDDAVFDSYTSNSGGCVFCGSSTYGDILCPSCANNID